ncbi:MAG: DNA cytosine methyltransferase, partial [Spirochaetales bacterium]|nr:DNA cytosine methyltransferase [Spirochaetales bacterium]
NLPCGAIDDRQKPLSENTMRRILNGIAKYWGEDAKPFLCRYNGGENRVHPIDEPVPSWIHPTATDLSGLWLRSYGARADAVKQIGNAVCPKMAKALVEAV